MTDRTARCSPRMAKAILKTLVGDGEWATPSGTPAYVLFATQSVGGALEEYEQVFELPEGERMRDIMERLGEDGRALSAS